MKKVFQWIVLIQMLTVILFVDAYADGFHVSGRLIDGGTQQPITNVEVQFLFSSLSALDGDQPAFMTTNTNTNGEFDFGSMAGELEGEVRVLQLPPGDVAPLLEQIHLSILNPTNQVIFRAGPVAALSGTIVITNGITDLTEFTIEVNAAEVNAATNGTFLIPELPVYQQTMRLIYQDGYYFDERVIALPAMTPGQTNAMQISAWQPMQNLTTSGVLHDATGNVLANARIRFLGSTTGVLVGMKTDADGNYAIYDLPDDCYTVRAFVGRYGIEQRTLSVTDSMLCVVGGGIDSVGDGIPDVWRQQFFGGTGTTTNSQSCATCDPDGDGVRNLDEYRRGTDPTNSLSINITLYANSNSGNNGFDGFAATLMNGHGPKLTIQAAINAAINGDSVQIAGDQAAYTDNAFSPGAKSINLKPTGTVTICP